MLTLHNRNLKKQINYENFEKPEMLFSLNYVLMKSTEDLSNDSMIHEDYEDFDKEDHDDIKNRIVNKVFLFQK